MVRDKLRNPLCLVGQSVILEEIAPKYFSYIIQWRNDKELNRYLNQPFELTMELETRWYEEVYLKDGTQGLLLMIDKQKQKPFGTLGWTDMDFSGKRCIGGRILRGFAEYRGSDAYKESFVIYGDYLYQYVDVIYAHVVRENLKSIKLHKRLGFVFEEREFQYPKEAFVNGMHQLECYRTKQQYVLWKQKGMA